MNFRLLVPTALPEDERRRLADWLVEVGHMDASVLRARLEEEPAWIAEVPSRDEAEALQEVLLGAMEAHFALTPVFADPMPSQAVTIARLRGGPPPAGRSRSAAPSRGPSSAPRRVPAPSAPPLAGAERAPAPVEEESLELARDPARPPPPAPAPGARKLPSIYVVPGSGEEGLAAPKDRWYQGRPTRWWLQALLGGVTVLAAVWYLAWPEQEVVIRRPALANRDHLGPHCSPGVGWYEVNGVYGEGPVFWKTDARYERGGPSGACETRVTRNPLGCEVVLLSGRRGLTLGKGPAMDLTFEVPGVDGALGRGTYEVDTLPGAEKARWVRQRKNLRIRAPIPEPKGLQVTSSVLECARWVGQVTVHSLGWRSAAAGPPVEVSLSWDLTCKRRFLPQPMGGPNWPDREPRPSTRGCVNHGESHFFKKE